MLVSNCVYNPAYATESFRSCYMIGYRSRIKAKYAGATTYGDAVGISFDVQIVIKQEPASGRVE